jgi:hypothetical protein
MVRHAVRLSFGRRGAALLLVERERDGARMNWSWSPMNNSLAKEKDSYSSKRRAPSRGLQLWRRRGGVSCVEVSQ